MNTIDLVQKALQRYGMEYRPVDTTPERWANNPLTQDGGLYPNCIVLKNASKKQIDSGFSALKRIQNREPEKKKLCFFMFIGHGVTNTGMQELLSSYKNLSKTMNYYETVRIEKLTRDISR